MNKGKKTKPDIRVQRTCRLLTESLLELLEVKVYEDIYITDICEKAHVHRTTFYKHFNDKDHLLVYLTEQIQNSFELEYNKGISDKLILNSFYALLEFLKSHRTMFLSEDKTIINDTLLHLLFLTSTEKLKIELPEPFCNIPENITKVFYGGALLSIAKQWLQQDMVMPIETLTSYADTLIYCYSKK